jgi:hypothetical protein
MRSSAVLFASAALLALAAPVQADPLPMHPSRHLPTPSPLPPPHLIGDAATRLKHRYGGTPIDVTTYHYDLYRSGWNNTETDLTPATVASANFGNIATLNVDGNVFAQPMLLSGFQLPDGSTHDVLIIATGNNSVYAYDADSYTLLWQVNLGTAQSTTDVGCGDVHPEYGISGSPVIVRSGVGSAVIYLVAAVEPQKDVFAHYLHALDAGTGADTITPVKIHPKAKLAGGQEITLDPQNQWNRVSLAYNNGSVYVGFGSHCDNNAGAITGWLLNYNTSLKLQHAFHTIKTAGGTELSSIWMTGFAPSIDPSGNVFVVTGNGDFTNGKKDWGESVLKLTPDLKTVLTSFTPYKYNNLNNGDTDFGSGGVMLLPTVQGQTAPPMAVALGKASVLYLLNQDSLGGVQQNDAGALQWQNAGGGGLWGGPAYWDGPSGPTVFTQTNGDVLRAWSVNTGSTPSLTQYATGTSGAGYGGSLPIVSSNGAAAGTGVVWLINRANEPFSIEAYDATALGNPIFSAQIGTWSNAGQGNPFLTPIEANGRVYGTGYKVVQVYGLKQ